MRADATHIFDGLNSFPTHVAHMRLGSFVTDPTPWPFAASCDLYHTALHWLKEDREHRLELERQGRKTRGATRNEVSNSGNLAFVFCSSNWVDCPYRLRNILQEVSFPVLICPSCLMIATRYDYHH